MIPPFVALAGNALHGRLLSGLASLWRTFGSQRSPLANFAPANPSATQLVRIAGWAA